MANGSSLFAEVIQNDRANRESNEWRGTLLDYLEKVRKDPSLTMLAHTRLYNMLMSEGISNLLDSDDPRVKRLYKDENLKAYNFFKDEFFHRGESGGTLISSGYNKALEIIRDRYHPSVWNVYTFHCSDSDNFDSDNSAAFKAAKELCDVCNLFGYGEINLSRYSAYESSMIELFRQLRADNFKSVTIAGKEYIGPSFCAFLARERPHTAAVAA